MCVCVLLCTLLLWVCVCARIHVCGGQKLMPRIILLLQPDLLFEMGSQLTWFSWTALDHLDNTFLSLASISCCSTGVISHAIMPRLLWYTLLRRFRNKMYWARLQSSEYLHWNSTLIPLPNQHITFCKLFSISENLSLSMQFCSVVWSFPVQTSFKTSIIPQSLLLKCLIPHPCWLILLQGNCGPFCF